MKPKKYGDGGRMKALAPEDAAIANVLMNRNRGKNFVDRAYDMGNGRYAPTIATNTLPGIDMQGNRYSGYPSGQYSSHLMGWSPTEDNRNIVFPYLTENAPRRLQYQSPEDNAMNHALQTGQYIEAPTQHIAESLSEYGYKKAAGIPTQQYGGTINDNSMKKKFKNGGYTVPGYNRQAQNGMMEHGGYLEFMQQNPNLAMMQYGGNNGGVVSIDDIGRQPYPQPHKDQGSTMNGSSWSKYGGNIDNKYIKDSEHEITEQEAHRLRSLGYDFDIIG